jgi:cell division protein FtsA
MLRPVSFQGKHVSLSVFDAVAPLIHVGALQTMAFALDLTLVAVVAEPFALADALLSPLVRELGAVYIDVGAGTTTVAVARETGVTGYRSLPLGGHTLTRTLALALALPWEEAEERKRQMAAGMLPDVEAATVRAALAADLQEWTTAVRTALEELAAQHKLPPFVYLCGGASTLPAVVEALQDIGQMAGSPFAAPPRIASLGPRDMGVSLDAHLPPVDAADTMALALARQVLVAESPTSTVDELLIRVSRSMGPG